MLLLFSFLPPFLSKVVISISFLPSKIAGVCEKNTALLVRVCVLAPENLPIYGAVSTLFFFLLRTSLSLSPLSHCLSHSNQFHLHRQHRPNAASSRPHLFFFLSSEESFADSCWLFGRPGKKVPTSATSSKREGEKRWKDEKKIFVKLVRLSFPPTQRKGSLISSDPYLLLGSRQRQIAPSLWANPLLYFPTGDSMLK